MAGNHAKQMRLGLIKAGAVLRPIYRQERDGNGVAVGEKRHVGCMLCLKYQPARQSQLKIDVPGTIVRAESDHIEGVMYKSCGPTGEECAAREDDMILVDGKLRRIVNAMRLSGGLTTLVLDDE